MSGRGPGGLVPKAKRKKAAKTRRKTRPRRASASNASRIETALAGLAHDIRTPLTGILALADLLQASDLPEREQRWAAAIKGASEHLARLTTLVVDAAKASASGLILRSEPFSLRDLANGVADSLVARAEGKGLTVDVAIAQGLPNHVSGDSVRLRSALENLIDNAVKFTERGSVGLTIAASRAARGRVRLVFTVTDSGIGIVSGDLKRLFKPFSQANADVARRYGGAGLGLVFVKRIAVAMGGDLSVTSRPGQGSSFRLSIVVEKAAPAKRAAIARQNTPRLRVLCVEDNPYGRVVLNAVLGELGHDLTFVGSAQGALSAVARGAHDVVLMDVALPDLDGLEATRRIRKLPPPIGLIPIIGLSGKTDADDQAAALAAGMDAYLRKPASPAALSETMLEMTSRRR